MALPPNSKQSKTSARPSPSRDGVFITALQRRQINGMKADQGFVRDWFRDKALEASDKKISQNSIFRRSAARDNSVDLAPIGKLLFYRYDPKHKVTLPYYDIYPMVFPVELYSDGFLGLNLHYLPPVFRARLLDALYTVSSNQRNDSTTKLNLAYKTLKQAAKMRYFAPCVKRYLYTHVKSDIISVPTKEWDYALFLPLQKFVKATERKVWDDSLKQIGNKP